MGKLRYNTSSTGNWDVMLVYHIEYIVAGQYLGRCCNWITESVFPLSFLKNPESETKNPFLVKQ